MVSDVNLHPYSAAAGAAAADNHTEVGFGDQHALATPVVYHTDNTNGLINTLVHLSGKTMPCATCAAARTTDVVTMTGTTTCPG